MLKKIFGTILFLILPILIIIILGDIILFIYKDTILEGLKALGNKEVLSNISPYRFGYILIIAIFFLSYKIMGRKIFLVTILFWITAIGSILFFLNKPIEGLVDIPDSVFTLSGIDLNQNIPKLSTETCNQIDMLLASLSGTEDNNSRLYQFSTNESYKENILKEHSQYIPILQYIHVPRINNRSYGLQPDFQKMDLQSNKNAILSGNYTLENLIEKLPNEKQVQYRKDELQNQKMREEFYKPWKNSLNEDLSEVVSIFYTDEEQENIKKLIEVINTINNNDFGYCIKNTGNATMLETVVPNTTYELKIIRILAQYSIIQASIGNYVDAYKMMNTLSQHIYQHQQHTFTLVGSMINIAMKGVYYNTFHELQKFDMPKSLQKKLVNDIGKFNNTSMMLNAFRGEYYLSSHWMVSRDFDPSKLYIPVILNGEETDMINRNIFASMLFMIDSNIPASKYVKDPEGFVIDTEVGPMNIYNSVGHIMISALTPTASKFLERSLLNDIEKNTVISSVGE